MLGTGPVVLRPLRDEDALSLAELANNRKIWINLRDIMPFPYAVGDAVFFIDLVKDEIPKMTFAIDFNRQFCGVISLKEQQDVYKKSAEIGYWIGEPFWGKGIATEAVRLITDYGLTRLGYIRIHTGVFESNAASMKVLEKNGYLKEGIFIKAVLKDGRMFDEHRFAITK